MIGNRQVLQRLDRQFEVADRRMERIDAHMARGNVVMERIEGEFQMSHQILGDLLRQSEESHREVMKRLEDLGVHMREQTQALMRIQSAVDPDGE